MTIIEQHTMTIGSLPKKLDEIVEQLRRIANVLEKMEEKDGPTIGQIVHDAIERGKENADQQ